MTKRDKGTALYVSKDVAIKIKQLAKDEHRTIKTVIERAVDAYIKNNIKGK